MNKLAAEKIINNYGAAIAKDEKAFKKESSLPCSKAMIRQAFYIYIPAIIDELGRLPKKMGDNLVQCYCMLDCFLPDKEADRLNDIGQQHQNKKLNIMDPSDQEKINEYITKFTSSTLNGNYFDEINQFIGDCYKEKGIK